MTIVNDNQSNYYFLDTRTISESPLHNKRRVTGEVIHTAAMSESDGGLCQSAGFHLCQGIPWHVWL